MACEFFQRLGAYHDQELPATEYQAFETHLAQCRECAAELARLQRLSRFLSAAAAVKVHRPRVIVLNAIRQRQSLLHFAELLTVAASVMIIACSIALFRTSSQTERASVPVWERIAVTQQLEPTPAMETDDPVAEAVLRE